MQRKPSYISKVIMDWHGHVLERCDVPYDGPWSLCEGDDEGGDDKSADGDGDGEESNKTEAEKELARVLEENRKLKEEHKKSAAAKRKAEADKRTKKAIEEDKLKDELLKREEELEKEREARESLEQAAKDRVDRAIGKLPKEAQEEIELVRDDLSLTKLEALVERKSTSPTTDDDSKDKDRKPGGKPPTVGVGGNDRRERKGKHELHPETVGVVKAVGGIDQLKTAEGMGSTSDKKFGWGRVEDQSESNANFMHLLNRIKATPVGGVSEEALRGRLEEKK